MIQTIKSLLKPSTNEYYTKCGEETTLVPGWEHKNKTQCGNSHHPKHFEKQK